MREIYLLLLVVITAVGSSVATMYAKPLLARIKRLFTRFKGSKRLKWGKHKLTQQQINELIERRLNLLDKQNASFHDRLSNIDDDLEWQAEQLQKRDKGRKEMVRREVRDYLNELKNG